MFCLYLLNGNVSFYPCYLGGGGWGGGGISMSGSSNLCVHVCENVLTNVMCTERVVPHLGWPKTRNGKCGNVK